MNTHLGAFFDIDIFGLIKTCVLVVLLTYFYEIDHVFVADGEILSCDVPTPWNKLQTVVLILLKSNNLSERRIDKNEAWYYRTSTNFFLPWNVRKAYLFGMK